MPEIQCVDQSGFTLSDGRRFRHLFRWSYVPDLEDFQKLFFYCPGMAGAEFLID